MSQHYILNLLKYLTRSPSHIAKKNSKISHFWKYSTENVATSFFRNIVRYFWISCVSFLSTDCLLEKLSLWKSKIFHSVFARASELIFHMCQSLLITSINTLQWIRLKYFAGLFGAKVRVDFVDGNLTHFSMVFWFLEVFTWFFGIVLSWCLLDSRLMCFLGLL